MCSEIDNSPEYDSLDICNQDEEDEYFNDEEPEDANDNRCSDMQLMPKTTDDDDVDYMDFPL